MTKDELIAGRPFFGISYFDEEMSAPEIVTHIYICKNMLPNDNDSEGDAYYFQDAESYFMYGRFTEITNRSLYKILRLTERTLSCITNIHGLAEEINRVSITGTGFISYSDHEKGDTH